MEVGDLVRHKNGKIGMVTHKPVWLRHEQCTMTIVNWLDGSKHQSFRVGQLEKLEVINAGR
jgi:hypothetical protein